MLPVKFYPIPFSGSTGEVQNVSANQRPERPSCFPIVPKTHFEEVLEILLPVKFRWILFSGYREEVKNISANQMPRRPSWFFNEPEKHKLIRGRWDLASFQVSLNSVQRLQRNLIVSANQRPGRSSWFSDWSETNFKEDIEILRPVKLRWILFSGCREVENFQSEAGWPSRFLWWAKKLSW